MRFTLKPVASTVMLEEDTRKFLETVPIREKALLGLAYYTKIPGNTHWVLRPRWRVLAPGLTVLIVLLYAIVATCKYWIDHNFYGCKETPYWDMYLYIIPNRIPFTNFIFLPDFLNRIVMDARIRQQQRMIRMIKKSPENLYELFYLAKIDPANVDIQFEAAYFLAAPEWQNRANDAFDLLDRTLPAILDKRERAGGYLERYVKFCSMYEQDSRVIHAGEKYLNDPRLPANVRANFALACAEAHYLKGNYKRSIELVERYKIGDIPQGFLLRMRILWESGRQEQTITRLKERIATSSEGREQLLYALTKFFWEQDRFAEAVVTLGEICTLNPNDYKPRVRRLTMLAKTGDKTVSNAEIETFFSTFGSNPDAMLALGGFAAEQGDLPLQKRIEALALENHFNQLSSFRLLIIETLVTAGRNAEALEQVGDLFMRKPVWLKKNKSVELQFEALRMLAYFANGQTDLGTITLGRLLNEDLTIFISVATARRLLALNYTSEAERILYQAYTRNRNNQSVLLELVKLDLKNGTNNSLEEHLSLLLENRRPPRHILLSAFEVFGSDRFLFSPNREALLEKMDDLLHPRVP